MTSDTWAPIPSHGLFVYSERAPTPALCRAWLAALTDGLRLDAQSLQMSTKNYFLRWRKYSAKAVEQAFSADGTLSIALAVGAPSRVHLGGRIQLRIDASFSRPAPWIAWLACEAERWPAPAFVPVARRWLELAATLGAPLSGGILAGSDLWRVKNEASLEREGSSDSSGEPGDVLFGLRLDGDSSHWIAEKLRRLYPITLLGPRYAGGRNADLLRAAGARVEPLGNSLLVETYPEIIPVWSAEYLAATVALRRLAWPISLQNAADAVGLGMKTRFEVPRIHYRQMPRAPSWEDVDAELLRETKAFDALLKARPPAPSVDGALDVR